MHEWGDEGVDWNGINNAAEYIATFCRRWGRIGGQYKEKYGTVRFYANFHYGDLHSLTHPGWANYGWYPGWLITFNCEYSRPILKWTGVNMFMHWLQPKIYNMAYQRALKKWPHLRAEILNCADHLELIKGVTRVEGNKTHILGWNGEIISTWTTSGGSDD